MIFTDRTVAIRTRPRSWRDYALGLGLGVVMIGLAIAVAVGLSLLS